jgi:hypothetical protein
MARHTLRMDDSALRQVGIDRAKRLVNQGKRRTLNRSAVLCPVDNGNLRASGEVSPTVVIGNIVRASVTYTAEYAAAVHNGRRALTIRAKNRANGRRGFLKFEVGGRTVYARQVHQPARAGRPFLYQGMVEATVPLGFRVTRTVRIG